jgi:hypothetical protein
MLQDLGITAAVLGFTAVYVAAFTFFLARTRERRQAGRREFFEALGNGLKTGAVVTLEDVTNLFKAAYGGVYGDEDYRGALTRRLREFLLEVVRGGAKGADAVGSDATHAVEWKEMITALIRANDAEAPYAGLPPAERGVIMDISRITQAAGPEADQKLSQLAGLIEARHDDLGKIRATNRWSVPLSVIGIVLTLFFGVLSFLYAAGIVRVAAPPGH